MSNPDDFDLDDLARALRERTPAPERAKKADVLAKAMENFDAVQGMAGEPRPTSDRPKGGIFRGVRLMLTNLTSRAVLGVTTALTAVAAVAMLAVLPNMNESLTGGLGGTLSLSGDTVALEDAESIMVEPVAQATDLMVAAEATQKAAPTPAPAPADSGIVMFSGRAEQADPSGSPMVSRGLAAARVAQDQPYITTLPAPIPDLRAMPEADTEAYPEAEANPLKITAEEPVSTFSIDVDTASWSMVRRALTSGSMPPKGAVRIEEMINYFTYDYAGPEAGDAFSTSVAVTQTPWNADTQLVRIGLQAELPAERPPLNLVFLIDTSGSMNQPDKLPLLIQSFRLMLGELTANDSVAIVTYAGSAGQVLDPTPASDRDTILAAFERLEAGGGTAGQAGLQQAYATAAAMSDEGEVSRVILATDGDFNVGLSDPDALKTFIADKREEGTYLSVLGFGRGNLDDATMQALAQSGNGMAAYIDTLAEAQKVLVDQLTGALVPVANDVKIQVEFNPAAVAEYRLIGYETRALSRTDFNNDRVDAGEIGAGHQVTALYEITPVGSPAVLGDPLRYGTGSVADSNGELGFLRLRYKTPGQASSALIESPIVVDATPQQAGFAAAIAGFGQLLTDGNFTGDWSYDDAIALAQANKGDDPFGYRQEAITLMRLAHSLDR